MRKPFLRKAAAPNANSEVTIVEGAEVKEQINPQENINIDSQQAIESTEHKDTQVINPQHTQAQAEISSDDKTNKKVRNILNKKFLKSDFLFKSFSFE